MGFVFVYEATIRDSRYAVQRWFQANVPERTLYNWQNAAAKLVAQDLREGIHVDERRKTKDE